jgi:DNA-binding PadR family transcriptional regulator
MSRGYSPEELPTRQEAARRVEENKLPLERENSSPEISRGGGGETQSRTGTNLDVRPTESRSIGPRRPYQLRDHTYTLRNSDLETMADIGTFRAIATKDLECFAYAGNRKHLEADLTNLRRQGLLVEREIPDREDSPRRLVALTKKGRRLLLATKAVPEEQAVYHGFVKPREAHHDADLYRLYQHGVERIAREGGKNPRVILDSELKRDLYREMAKAGGQGPSSDFRAEIAERHGLTVVRGKIPVPDLRIEYETRDDQPAHLDLELATEHYRSQNLAQKARAGFSIYARPKDASNLRRVLDQQELTAEILNL